MAQKRIKTLDEKLAGALRFVRALDREATEWEPHQLAQLRKIEEAVTQVRTTAVMAMRVAGYTDSQIAQELGVTQQAVSKRWPGGGRYQGAAGRYRTAATTTGGR